MRRLESEIQAEQGPVTETRFPGPIVPRGDGQAMLAFCGADRKERAPRRRSWTKIARGVVEEARERMEVNRWEDADARHLVGLYVLLHERVYGVEPTEVLGDGWPGAVSAAGKLARELEGVERAVEFLRWTWMRERAREKKREPGSGSRIGWRLQFAARSLVTDWKVDVVRGDRAARPKKGAGG